MHIFLSWLILMRRQKMAELVEVIGVQCRIYISKGERDKNLCTFPNLQRFDSCIYSMIYNASLISNSRCESRK
ncbi:uncharacterized protein BKA78DRAFT_314682 [Phyllosticta capitalensis]|uniref:uncharacterized protein n=1 Tax=Phyllosticta capitalensis TaxID=121624 RepID=UPI00313033D9